MLSLEVIHKFINRMEEIPIDLKNEITMLLFGTLDVKPELGRDVGRSHELAKLPKQVGRKKFSEEEKEFFEVVVYY